MSIVFLKNGSGILLLDDVMQLWPIHDNIKGAFFFKLAGATQSWLLSCKLVMQIQDAIRIQ